MNLFCQNLYKKFKKNVTNSNNLVDVIKLVFNNKDVKYHSNGLKDFRKELSKKYLYGKGLEIGALHNPLWVNSDVTVKYIDRMDRQSLYNHYPELIGTNLIEIDIIDNGETLNSIEDHSVNFVIANHFLEHSEDPILTIKNMLRVLTNGGIIYLSIPNMQKTFDVNREPTTLAHIISDHKQGAIHSRKNHYEEWVRFVEPHFGRIYPEEAVSARVDELQKQNYSIHFHCWTLESFKEFLSYFSSQFIDMFVIKEMKENNDEFIAIIQKN
jgi:SAM-dependent methyltransferase